MIHSTQLRSIESYVSMRNEFLGGYSMGANEGLPIYFCTKYAQNNGPKMIPKLGWAPILPLCQGMWSTHILQVVHQDNREARRREAKKSCWSPLKWISSSFWLQVLKLCGKKEHLLLDVRCCLLLSGWDEHIPVYCFPYSFCAVPIDDGQSKRQAADDIPWWGNLCDIFLCHYCPG